MRMFFRMINTNNLFVYSDTLFKEQVDKASRCHAYTFSQKITSCAIPCWDRHLQAWRWRCDYDRHMQYSSKSQAHHCRSDRRYVWAWLHESFAKCIVREWWEGFVGTCECTLEKSTFWSSRKCSLEKLTSWNACKHTYENVTWKIHLAFSPLNGLMNISLS